MDPTKLKRFLCKNWKDGMCLFGDRCTFAHGSTDLNLSVGLCEYAENCRFGEKCNRRHLSGWMGDVKMEDIEIKVEEVKVDEVKEEIKEEKYVEKPIEECLKQPNKKTRLCDKWKAGCCVFSDLCIFAHGSSDYNECVCVCPQFQQSGNKGCKNGELCEFKHRLDNNWDYKSFCIETMTIKEMKDLMKHLHTKIEEHDEQELCDEIELILNH